MYMANERGHYLVLNWSNRVITWKIRSFVWFSNPLFWLYDLPLISYSVTVWFPLKRNSSPPKIEASGSTGYISRGLRICNIKKKLEQYYGTKCSVFKQYSSEHVKRVAYYGPSVRRMAFTGHRANCGSSLFATVKNIFLRLLRVDIEN